MPIIQEEILKALTAVTDPDLHENIVKLGFVKNIRICEGSIAFDIELTTPACPVKERMQKEAQEAVKKLPGVTEVNVTMTSQVRSSLPPSVAETLRKIKNIVAVASGKGGVGKSTVSVNLALALSRSGAKVGLMDADVYGPSVPKMLDGFTRPEGKDGKLIPNEAHGIKFMSMGLLTDKDTPVIWRGPMATKLIQQFLSQVEWGELDYLLVDLPPGTGDVQLTLTQSAPLTGAVIVTTPQEVAVDITTRGIKMFDQVQVPILGIIENMSGFACPHCNETTDIFKSGGGEKAAKANGIPFLGKIPIDPALTIAGDVGHPVVTAVGASRPPSADAFDRVASAVAARVSTVVLQSASVTHRAKEVTKNANHVVVLWEDGAESRFNHRELRLECPCAECIDEWSGKKRLRPEEIPESVEAVTFRSVGRYGVQISWSDGHSTGIYTFNRLRELAERPKGSATASDGTSLQDKIVETLRTIFDPEIPLNIYDLGLIYGVDISPERAVTVRMTLTSPSCPAAESLPPEVVNKVKAVVGVASAKIELVWEPPWGKEMMSEAARLQLGL